jgi:hypothetical protein
MFSRCYSRYNKARLTSGFAYSEKWRSHNCLEQQCDVVYARGRHSDEIVNFWLRFPESPKTEEKSLTMRDPWRKTLTDNDIIASRFYEWYSDSDMAGTKVDIIRKWVI